MRVGDGSVPVCSGDSVAAAMIADGRRAFRESVTPEARRGVWCGMGVCHECALTIDGHQGSLACMTEAAPGMRVQAQPARRAVGTDAGTPLPEQEIRPDVLVVGAGPAGLSAARDLAAAGLDVLVADDRADPGGQFYKQPSADPVAPERLDAQYRAGRALITAARAAGATFLSGVTVWGAFAPDQLVARSATGRWTIRPRALVLATGAYERGVPIPGWTLPGVMTTGAGQTLLRRYQVAPGNRVLVAGNGPLNLQLAAELTRAGVRVVGLVEAAPLFRPGRALAAVPMVLHVPLLARDGGGYLATLARHRVPVFTGAVVERLTGDPASGVRTAVIAGLAADGTATGRRHQVDVDAVCLGYGFMPSNELARTLGCAEVHDPVTGASVIRTDAGGRTSLPRVRVLGDGATIRGATFAQAQGAVAAAGLIRELTGRDGPIPTAALRATRRHLAFQRAVQRVFAAPLLTDQLADDDTVICRCEDVTLGRLRESELPGMATAGSVKRLTRAGMGRCQGRYCGPVLAAMSLRAAGDQVADRPGFAPQSPVRPVPVGDIAIG
jgi:NADPH-dependent 2,4-dienoyl-CoA reductase/sulfur reductase-like enzyme